MNMSVSRKGDCAQDDISEEALQDAMENILNQMKEALQQGESLTSESVVQLSQQLDTYVLVAQIRKMRCVS
ncbi:Spo0E family sporulation regulatory protein-aspartic acid phosphatase [Paenibacillus ehimensis]|uniref:Spo0E family sporulation regulatory protein-aspartic acid phosphatase n=1 Tax=Paenibacillus ehimensis TaxID=79264 RepID=UPI002DBF6DE7|nr:Spo0E family sporulation regulatory protein-aspartic acid phosphatase [Paenibacillus ehimensis]MEC0210264.1 Spo0E family sporulation regulatory protein-aspartic acid phosphatase [Paenibacillus ehimensis]